MAAYTQPGARYSLLAYAQGRIPTPRVRLPLLPAGSSSVALLLARLAELDGAAAITRAAAGETAPAP